MHRGVKKSRKRMAASSVDGLIRAAIGLSPNDATLAERYLLIALKLCERYRVRRPLLLRRLYCRRCKRPIFPGRTSRYRIRRGGGAHLSITCLHCGSVARIPLNRAPTSGLARSGEGGQEQYS